MKIGFAACLAAVIATPAAQAADVKVLASPNMRPLLTDVAPELEKSGQTLVVTYDSAGAVKSRAAGGEDTDVVITLRPLLDELAAQGTAKGVAIAKKEADFGIDQLTVVDGKPGVEVVGVLSPQFGVDIVMGAGVSAGSKAPDGAAAVVNYLTSPAAAPLIKKRGMEPG